MTETGTYVLVVDLPEPTHIDVGALGANRFPAGGYTYTGSAFGSGGFGRIDRHRRVAAGEHDVRHWHVDYLLSHPLANIVGVERVAEVDCECDLARDLLDAGDRTVVPGFGASDCDCRSHLSRFVDAERASEQALTATEPYR